VATYSAFSSSDAATGSATSRSPCRNLHIHPAPQHVGSGRGAEAHKGLRVPLGSDLCRILDMDFGE
jgi:hypothetical protein